ncbi:MAG: DUF1330 domain-containing protein [Geminicoccales bacterium]
MIEFLCRARPGIASATLPLGLAIGLLSAGLSTVAQAADSVTAVILATPSADGGDARKEYSEKVNPLGEAAGVEIIKGVRVSAPLVGELGYKAVFLLGFNSEQAAQDFFSSDDYQALIPLRDEGYDQYDVLMGQ